MSIPAAGRMGINTIRLCGYNEELAVFPVVAKFATVGKENGKNPVVANFATTAADGKVYQVEYYMT